MEGCRRSVAFSNQLAQAQHNSASEAKLQQKLHVVLPPGIYDLTEPLVINSANQVQQVVLCRWDVVRKNFIHRSLPCKVLLGLGLATLRAKSSQGAVQVKACGARVAG